MSEMYVKELLTVSELISQQRPQRVWLCPSVVEDVGFNLDPIYSGIEAGVGNIPEVLLDKQVTRWFRECGMLCIIWLNNRKEESNEQ